MDTSTLVYAIINVSIIGLGVHLCLFLSRKNCDQIANVDN
jgi:hypothetical protein